MPFRSHYDRVFHQFFTLTTHSLISHLRWGWHAFYFTARSYRTQNRWHDCRDTNQASTNNYKNTNKLKAPTLTDTAGATTSISTTTTIAERLRRGGQTALLFGRQRQVKHDDRRHHRTSTITATTETTRQATTTTTTTDTTVTATGAAVGGCRRRRSPHGRHQIGQKTESGAGFRKLLVLRTGCACCWFGFSVQWCVGCGRFKRVINNWRNHKIKCNTK